jgi:hypothetical protein
METLLTLIILVGFLKLGRGKGYSRAGRVSLEIELELGRARATPEEFRSSIFSYVRLKGAERDKFAASASMDVAGLGLLVRPSSRVIVSHPFSKKR